MSDYLHYCALGFCFGLGFCFALVLLVQWIRTPTKETVDNNARNIEALENQREMLKCLRELVQKGPEA